MCQLPTRRLSRSSKCTGQDFGPWEPAFCCGRCHRQWEGSGRKPEVVRREVAGEMREGGRVSWGQLEAWGQARGEPRGRHMP